MSHCPYPASWKPRTSVGRQLNAPRRPLVSHLTDVARRIRNGGQLTEEERHWIASGIDFGMSGWPFAQAFRLEPVPKSGPGRHAESVRDFWVAVEFWLRRRMGESEADVVDACVRAWRLGESVVRTAKRKQRAAAERDIDAELGRSRADDRPEDVLRDLLDVVGFERARICGSRRTKGTK